MFTSHPLNVNSSQISLRRKCTKTSFRNKVNIRKIKSVVTKYLPNRIENFQGFISWSQAELICLIVHVSVFLSLKNEKNIDIFKLMLIIAILKTAFPL